MRAPDGRVLDVPADWACLPPGDAGLTRRVKALGPSWAVVEKVGRKTFSKGVWVPAENLRRAKEALEAERATPAFARKRAASVKRREVGQARYVEDFLGAVRRFLSFTEAFASLEVSVAQRVTLHATPVGSGTVARTTRIPIDERAEAAVIAWLRHQTTAYDSMKVPNTKGARRALRRRLAEVARVVLDLHRGRVPHPPAPCALCAAIESGPQDQGPVSHGSPHHTES